LAEAWSKRVDFPIPGNDDASQSISKIVSLMAEAIKEGLSERKVDREKSKDEKPEVAAEETNA